MGGLFKTGEYKLHSGGASCWLINCEALTDKDIETLAKIISEKIEFKEVQGIPNGGRRLASALKKYEQNTGATLIVDDVLTTGNSFTEYSKKFKGDNLVGIVLFARGKCPYWVIPIFELNSNFRDL